LEAALSRGARPAPGEGIVQVLRRRAEEQGERRAFVFLDRRGKEQDRLTWGELDARARGIAGALRERSGAGARVLLAYPPGLELLAGFFGCLYSRMPAVPVALPHGERGRARFLAITRDAAPAVVLTSTESSDELLAQLASGGLGALDLLATDGPGPAGPWDGPAPADGDLAFLQYTSGSTSSPRGVMVSHGNLRHNSAGLADRFEHAADSVMVTWLPTFHDMGLIYAVLEPVFGGFPCVMMSPATFLRRPLTWLEAISRYGGTHSAAPNFGYELCVRRIPPEQRSGLALGRWKVALNGSEPVRSETLDRFSEAFREAGFRREAFNPSYGLAEATVMVSGRPVGEPPRIGRLGGRPIAGVGRPGLATGVTIVDPDRRQPCGDGEVGEIWVSGPAVAQGYWNRPDETGETFRAELGSGQGPFLRTGDLGFVAAGELYVTGRLKDLLIIAGRNHYPQDIEQTVEHCHPAVRPGSVAAFSIDGASEELLVVVAAVEPLPPGEALEVEGAIRQAVSEQHELRVHRVELVPPAAVPKTSSGKIQRRLCRELFLGNHLKQMAGEPPAVLQSGGRGLLA
jgi:acyl-CoA synthetase (AMP-forming)/AMP-acid ligase II